MRENKLHITLQSISIGFQMIPLLDLFTVCCIQLTAENGFESQFSSIFNFSTTRVNSQDG